MKVQTLCLIKVISCDFHGKLADDSLLSEKSIELLKMDEKESEIKDEGKKEPDYTSDELCVLFDQVKKNYSTLYGHGNKSQFKATKD